MFDHYYYLIVILHFIVLFFLTINAFHLFLQKCDGFVTDVNVILKVGLYIQYNLKIWLITMIFFITVGAGSD